MEDGRLDGRAVPLLRPPLSRRHHLRRPRRHRADRLRRGLRRPRAGRAPLRAGRLRPAGIVHLRAARLVRRAPGRRRARRGRHRGLARRARRPAPGTGRVFGTNPMACSVPRPGRPPLTVDQASSSTAFVSVRAAAERGTPLPEGWAVDAEAVRRPTPRRPWPVRCCPSAATRARTSRCSSSSCPRWRAATGRWTRRRGTRVRDRLWWGCSSSPSTRACSGGVPRTRGATPRTSGRGRGAAARRRAGPGPASCALTLRVDVAEALRLRAGLSGRAD